MKIETQIVSILLNNFHLIHKGDLLRTKVPIFRSEVAARKNSKFKVSFVIKKICSYISIIQILTKFEF
jgi:hypothetical protein